MRYTKHSSPSILDTTSIPTTPSPPPAPLYPPPYPPPSLSENDIEMLQLAALGVAMGNAGAKLKSVADGAPPATILLRMFESVFAHRQRHSHQDVDGNLCRTLCRCARLRTLLCAVFAQKYTRMCIK